MWQACNLSIGDVEAGGSGIQGQPQLHCEFKVNLGPYDPEATQPISFPHIDGLGDMIEWDKATSLGGDQRPNLSFFPWSLCQL